MSVARYFDDLLKANAIYGLIVGSVAYVILRIALATGLDSDALFLSLVAVVFVGVPVRARLTANAMTSQDIGFTAAHRQTSAEIRAWLSFLPVVGSLFGGDRYQPPPPPNE